MTTPLTFHVLSHGSRVPSQTEPLTAYLLEDNWDDWFRYSTMYAVVLVDGDGTRHDLGLVKIGELDMQQPRPALPPTFVALDERFFSLGQDSEYYKALAQFPGDIRSAFLDGMQDVVADDARWLRALPQDVTSTSLLRSVSRKSVTGQFRRLLHGGLRQTSFAFRFDSSVPGPDTWPVPALDFYVKPESNPPTNVHALIGRNGVGKSHLLHAMAHALACVPNDNAMGRFVSLSDRDEEPPFANVISVSFSAFDDFKPIDVRTETDAGVRYSYIGLTSSLEAPEPNRPPKTPYQLAMEFRKSAEFNLAHKRATRWRRVLALLESDPLFKEAGVADWATPDAAPRNANELQAAFARLSSGHKIVLLTVTRLVQTVEAQSLVLLDEPEAHLHPPLLSAYVRALTYLLMDRNAVAIVATHSPVVLQELPNSCVWVLKRSGTSIGADRPQIQTFGENVGVLTREVFRLEATRSGHHQLLMAAAREERDYDAALAQFDGEVGSEAKAVLRALVLEQEGASE